MSDSAFQNSLGNAAWMTEAQMFPLVVECYGINQCISVTAMRRSSRSAATRSSYIVTAAACSI